MSKCILRAKSKVSQEKKRQKPKIKEPPRKFSSRVIKVAPQSSHQATIKTHPTMVTHKIHSPNHRVKVLKLIVNKTMCREDQRSKSQIHQGGPQKIRLNPQVKLVLAVLPKDSHRMTNRTHRPVRPMSM